MRAAATAIAASRDAEMWIDDLCQEIALAQHLGRMVRLDRQGLGWLIHGLLDTRIGRRSRRTVAAVALMMAWRPSDSVTLAELREVWEVATPAQKDAITALLLNGSYQKGKSRAQTQRDSTALWALRRKVAA